jgi:hypothetical protein
MALRQPATTRRPAQYISVLGAGTIGGCKGAAGGRTGLSAGTGAACAFPNCSTGSAVSGACAGWNAWAARRVIFAWRFGFGSGLAPFLEPIGHVVISRIASAR